MEKERVLEEIFEQIVAENIPNLRNETSIHVQDAERTPPKFDHGKPTPRDIIAPFANIRSKGTVLNAARAKRLLTYRGKNIRITSDLSTETWQARKWWQHIFKVLSEKKMQPSILYSARLPFGIDAEITTFQDSEITYDFWHYCKWNGSPNFSFFRLIVHV